MELDLWLTAAICTIAFFALGYALSRSPQLWRIDVEAAALRGQATSLAALFTYSGRALPLTLLAATGFAVAVITHADVRAAVAVFIAQILSQGVVESVKHVFRRARPDAWLIRQELGFSYPSGHAVTAVVFFGSWLVLALMTPAPGAVRVVAVTLLATWIVGIPWSRMALSAHYPTDIAGGLMLGTGWTCALWALLLQTRVV